MLLRGQNILGYRHYANDVVHRFVEHAVKNGVKVFRIFDALNDPRNLETAVKAVLKAGGHAQGTISYTVSPVHTMANWLTLAKQLHSMGVDSIAIKDMSGLLTPYFAYELVKQLKASTELRIHIHSHATTGMSTSTAVKAIEAGADTIDTSISSMSMTYGHSATESLVSILKDTPYDTGLNLDLLQEIADYFRSVRKKYAKFEGTLLGVDPRIFKAQVPGGMLTNMESQLREQKAADKMAEVLEEIPRVRKELGYVPLVTPSSQIVGSQAVINVLSGERYKNITKETEGLLKGEYGKTPAPVDKELQQKVLAGEELKDYDPASRPDEMEQLTKELSQKAKEEKIELVGDMTENVLTYALFPQIGLKFLANRNNPAAFEPEPQEAPAQEGAAGTAGAAGMAGTAGMAGAAGETPSGDKAGIGLAKYKVKVGNKEYEVEVSDQGQVTSVPAPVVENQPGAPPTADGKAVVAPLAGNIFKVLVDVGDQVNEGDPLIIMEAMKMETEIKASQAGKVTAVQVRQGDSVPVGAPASYSRMSCLNNSTLIALRWGRTAGCSRMSCFNNATLVALRWRRTINYFEMSCFNNSTLVALRWGRITDYSRMNCLNNPTLIALRWGRTADYSRMSCFNNFTLVALRWWRTINYSGD